MYHSRLVVLQVEFLLFGALRLIRRELGAALARALVAALITPSSGYSSQRIQLFWCPQTHTLASWDSARMIIFSSSGPLSPPIHLCASANVQDSSGGPRARKCPHLLLPYAPCAPCAQGLVQTFDECFIVAGAPSKNRRRLWMRTKLTMLSP